jgi:hypothetical protein
MNNGYIKLSRTFFTSELWRTARTYNESEAWLDLIQSARFEASEHTARVGGRDITWGRGQYPASIRFLSSKWHWNERKVRSFMLRLKKNEMITTDDKQGMNVITLVNFEKYNNCNTSCDTAVDTVNATANATNKNLNINDLADKLTRQITQQLTQGLTQTRHSTDTNNNKDKESKERKENKELSPYTSYTPPTKGASINSRAREVFEKCFRDTFGNEYYWTGKDAGAMSGLLKKLSYFRSKKNLTNDDDSLLYALNVFLSSIKDGWIFENFSVTNINSKFNEIISQIYGKPIVKTKYQSAAEKAASRERLEELADEILASDQPDEYKGRFPFS